MLTTEACNALLKTLEEPPEHVVFILATTEPQKILPTIHSRCQRFDFHPITQEEIVAHLQKVAEGSDIKAEKEALELIAAASEGGMRDALSLLEQCGVMAETVTAETVRSVRGIIGREILRELVGAVGQREVASALTIFDRLLMQGKDISQILIELSGYMRALLLYRATPEYQPIYVTDTAEELAKLAKLYTGERILAAQEIIHQAMNELRFTARGRVTAEMCLYDLCREDNRTLKTLAARVNQLEREMAALKAGGLTAAVSQEPAVIAAPAETRKEKPAEVAKVKPTEVINTKPAETTKAKPTEASKVKAAEPVEKPVQQKPKEEAPVVPVKTPQPQPVTTAAKKEKAKTTVPEETKVAASPAGNNPSAIPPVVPGNTDVPGAGNGSSDQGYTPYAGDWATGDEYWTRTMEILKAERKQSIAACASHGYVMAYENQTLIVGFKMKYLCERLQKPDYREVVEDVLLRVARVPVRLQCVEDTGGKPAGKSSVKNTTGAPAGKSNTPAKREAQPNVSDSTKKAMEMFNATLHKV